MKKTKKSTKLSMIFDYILIVLQLVLSIVVAYFTKKVLPMKYWIIVAIVLALLWLLVFFVLNPKKRNRKTTAKHLVVRIVSLIMSIVLAFTSSVAFKGFSVLGNITGGNYQTQVISVIVSSDSTYETIKDLDGGSLGYVANLDTENTNTTLEAISSEEKTNVTTQTYENIEALENALSSSEVDAILLNEAYRGMAEEFDAGFSSNTKVIYQYEIRQEIETTASDVNVTKEPFSIYISGIDTYGPVSTVSRSDVNMVVTVNPNTKEILMTSIPRDYYVQLASFGAYDKLTHAGIYGVQESMATLENLLGVSIDYYARVNFTSLVTIVDALGGITVDNPEAFTSYHTHQYFPTGPINMDGETALEFTRERYSLSGGDRARVMNQQRVLTAILNKVTSPAILTNYSSFLNAISGSFETSLSSGDIQDLIQMQLNDMPAWNITNISLDGTGSSSTSCYSMPGYSLYVMEPDYSTVESAKAQIQAVINK